MGPQFKIAEVHENENSPLVVQVVAQVVDQAVAQIVSLSDL